ncbi:TPA: hypothetical protein DCQ44_03515, partial [Candidatus Taylorbacteria bacterium]|nr:hypothetical protein [Candidatus Taylorbacteria bacterium]
MDEETKKLVDELISDRQKFNDFVYTPINEAIAELKKRGNDHNLCSLVDKSLLDNIPESIKNQKSMVLFRHVATPNYEIRRFMIAADGLDELHPVIFEYTADKFTNRNYWKYSLGRLFLHKGVNKNKEQLFDTKIIIDFNESNNKPLNTIKTKWGQSLVDFHREMFLNSFKKMSHT